MRLLHSSRAFHIAFITQGQEAFLTRFQCLYPREGWPELTATSSCHLSAKGARLAACPDGDDDQTTPRSQLWYFTCGP